MEADFLRLMLTKKGYEVSSIARSVAEAIDILEKEKPGIVLLDIFLKGKLTGIDLAKRLHEDNIPFVFLSANSDEEVLSAAKATHPYGFLVKPFREKDLLVTMEIARYRHENSMESKLLKEGVLQKQLAAVINAAGSWEQKLLNIGKVIQPHIPFDFMGAGFNQIGEPSCNATSFLRIGYEEYQTLDIPGLLLITGKTMPELMKLKEASEPARSAAFQNGEDFKKACAYPSMKSLLADTFHMRSYFGVPLYLSNGALFNFCFYSRRADAYQTEHVALANRLKLTWEKSIEGMLAGNGPDVAPKRGGVEAAPGVPAGEGVFEGIIGRSHLLLNVFDMITQVAPSDTSVLIMGESGTGKERIADCIHRLSPRNGKPYIKVNCAALPPALIESELFGHEKGAFTGALERRTGKFELADKGTIFLDEIGEMPPELQVKLLRVLQEREVERIGARSPVKINVRVIAATNRNLEKEVAGGRFRLDLYYRLNVFPIVLPSLRERKEDIPALTAHFVHYYNRKAGRKINGLSDKAHKKLMAYHWPGNIRELEHLIERNILLSKGTLIEDIALPVLQPEASPQESRIKTMEQNERDHILAVLKTCNGRIWGPGAAAELLNIPPSTLKSKMKKLGIRKEYME